MQTDKFVRDMFFMESIKDVPLITEEQAMQYAYLFIKLEADKEHRLLRIRALMQPNIAEDLARLETQKIVDVCLLETNIENLTFNRASEHYKLDNNGHLSGYRQGIKAAAMAEKEKEVKTSLLKLEEADVLGKTVVEELGDTV